MNNTTNSKTPTHTAEPVRRQMHARKLHAQELAALRAQRDQVVQERDHAMVTCTELRAQRDELAAALREFMEADVSDARALAKAVAFDNNHRVTGTQAERIAFLLQTMERNARIARAALAKVQS